MIIDLFGDWCPGTLITDLQFSCNVSFVNIEGPILKPSNELNKSKITKLGPHLFSTHEPNFSNFSIYSLANNHIMDYGIQGMLSTIQLLENASGKCVGYDISRKRTDVVQFKTKESQVIAVIAIAEHQFGYAKDGDPGYLPYSDEVFSLIRKTRESADFVIISTHGGDEKSLLPSMNRRELLRKYIDSGANLIWGHHAHVPQGWEFWNHGLICYGMGNFVTDPNLISHKGLGQYSLTARIDTLNLKNTEFGIMHQSIVEDKIVVRRIGMESSAFKEYFSEINEILTTDSLLLKYQDMYADLIVKKFYSRVLPIYPLNYWPRYLFWSLLSKVKNRGRNRYGQTIQSLKLHFLDCESHRDMISHFNSRRNEILMSDHTKMKTLHERLNSLSTKP